jgi:Concanavalin A-like lectin/glucanases superfamily/PASTA domain
MACDPNFGIVSLLLHCDGINGSAVFVDSSSNANTMTTVGSTVIDTSDPQFGTGAMNLGPGFGAGGVTCPTGGAGGLFDMGSGDFTVEFGINIPSSIGFGVYVIGDGFGTSGQLGSTYNAAGTSKFNLSVNIGGSAFSADSPALTTFGAWHSVALVKSGTTITAYLDGVGGIPITVPAGALVTPLTSFQVGSLGTFGNKPPGEMDEIRVTKGLARYTGNYTPTGPFGGTCDVVVPDVTGQTLTGAIAALTGAGFTIGTVTTMCSNTVLQNSVISYSPLDAPLGTPVSLVVSTGPCGVTTVNVYGKFVGSPAFPPTLLVDAKGIKPRIYMPKENVTVKT